MRIPTGTTNRYLFFVAVDSTDFTTRETGLDTWTVVYCKAGTADSDVEFTTPTVTEIDGTTMPGVYSLLLDEATTISSGYDTEEVVLHITHAGMAPVTRTFELYRPKITEGQTVWTEADIVDSYTPQQALQAMSAVLLGKIDDAGDATETFRDLDDRLDRVAVTVDDDGNRTEVVITTDL